MDRQHWRDMKEAAVVEDELHWFMLNLRRRGISKGRIKQFERAIRLTLNLPTYLPKTPEQLKGELRHKLNGHAPQVPKQVPTTPRNNVVNLLDLIKRS